MSDVADSPGLFVALIGQFLAGTIAPAKFKEEYMRLWRECRDSEKLPRLNASTKEAFDRIFTAAESFCEDASLRDLSDLDEKQLSDQVAEILLDVEPRRSG